jgi:hypothetical protein
MVQQVKNKVRVIVSNFAPRLRNLSPQVSELVITSYIRSLILYYLTPLMAAGYIDSQQINMLDASIRRKLYSVPKDIHHTTVNNLL